MPISSKNPLKHYFEINSNKEKANFLKTKHIPIDINLDEDTSVLWDYHNKLVNRAKQKNNNKLSLLDLKIELAERITKKCEFCERKCKVNRKSKDLGKCGCSYDTKVASDFIHLGEEKEIIPSYTVFFSGCTFECVFCQNFDISQKPKLGKVVTPKNLAKSIDDFREGGAKNVNFVGGDPTPHIHTILRTLKFTKENIPIVFNSNMYLSKKAMNLLNGIVDVYLTDFKYFKNSHAKKYSKISKYFDVISRNHLKALDHAELLIRHLVLPNHIECCTKNILMWIRDNIGKNTRVNCMFQYRPQYRAYNFEEISRRLTYEEKKRVYEIVDEIGLENVSF